jgi:hypothetical protein
MKLIDVRIRIPKVRMGDLLDGILPPWAQFVGFDRLREIESAPNGKARSGTIASHILDFATRAVSADEIRAAMTKAHPELTRDQISKSISNLMHNGRLNKTPGGKYKTAARK